MAVAAGSGARGAGAPDDRTTGGGVARRRREQAVGEGHFGGGVEIRPGAGCRWRGLPQQSTASAGCTIRRNARGAGAMEPRRLSKMRGNVELFAISIGNLGHVSRAAAAITTVSPVAAGGPRRRSSCWGICCSAGGVRAGSELCEQALAGDTSPQQRLAEKGLESSSRPDKSCFSAVPGHKYRARSREGPSTALPCADSGTPARADRPAASRKLLRASLIGQEQ